MLAFPPPAVPVGLPACLNVGLFTKGMKETESCSSIACSVNFKNNVGVPKLEDSPGIRRTRIKMLVNNSKFTRSALHIKRLRNATALAMLLWFAICNVLRPVWNHRGKNSRLSPVSTPSLLHSRRDWPGKDGILRIWTYPPKPPKVKS